MKNSILPESELKILGELFKKVDELLENHEKTSLTIDVVSKASDTERLHTVLYLDSLKDLVTSAKTLQTLLKVSEEEFIKAVTNDGETSMADVKKRFMLKNLIDLMAD